MSNKTEGHIYVFTFNHFLQKNLKDPSYLRLVDSELRERPQFKTSLQFDSKKTVLIKIGYTRQTPTRRLQQWKHTCGQPDFVLMLPGGRFPSKKKGLSKLFSNLKLKEINYKHVNEDGDAFWSRNAYKSEQEIHKYIRKRFGSGKMFCDGCKSSPNKSGVHHEWFLIPREEMDIVWSIIDSQCI